MMYYGPGMGAGWTLIVFAVLLPALVLAAGLILAQVRHGPGSRPNDAEQVLAGRLARGEIETDEYQQRLTALRAGHR